MPNLEGVRRAVDVFPVQGEHLFAEQAGEHGEPERIAENRVVDFRLDAGPPARKNPGWRRNLAPWLRMGTAAPGEPETDRVAQGLDVGAGFAVEGA